MKKHHYIIALGSNIEADKNIHSVLEILAKEMTLISISQLKTTAPVGYKYQDNFLNGAAYIESSLDYELFKNYLKELEKRLKRVKGPIKSGPRTIDLDIIVHNNILKDKDFYTAQYIRDPVAELLEKEAIQLIA